MVNFPGEQGPDHLTLSSYHSELAGSIAKLYNTGMRNEDVQKVVETLAGRRICDDCAETVIEVMDKLRAANQAPCAGTVDAREDATA